MEFSNTNDVRGKRSFGSLTAGNNILHPYALFHQNEANNAFQNISDLHHGKYCQHMSPVNRLRQYAMGTLTHHTNTLSNRNVIMVLPPERRVK